MKVSNRISYEQFRSYMEAITNPKDLALFALIYCCYARVGEVTRNEYRYKTNPPINKDNIEFTDNHMIVTVLTEKTLKYRRVPSSRALENWLHEPIRAWRDVCGYELFPISTRNAEYKFQKWFGTQNIHLLRHWACTHALQGKRTKNRLKAYEVAQLGGWSDLDFFYKSYNHLLVEDFIGNI